MQQESGVERAPVWRKAAPLPGLCADGAALLAQGSRAPGLDFIFHVGCTLFCCTRGCSLCASPPPFRAKDMHDFIHERYM